MGNRQKSFIEAESKHGSSCTFTVEYDVAEKMKFSVLSAGKAADAGVWTVIGPGTQCMIRSNETPHVKEFLKGIDSIPLVKKRSGWNHWGPWRCQGGSKDSSCSTS